MKENWKMKLFRKLFICSLTLLFVIPVFANLTVPIYSLKNNQLIGNVVISQSQYGLIFTPALKGLPPGIHGIHIHQNPSCAENGMAAGGHWDPQKNDQHEGPYGKGHLGDLPALAVDSQGLANVPLLAPKLHSLNQLKGHALIIHAGGDNYSDTPEKLGGGGSRIACGVIR